MLGEAATGQAEGGLSGVVVVISSAPISKRAVRGDRRERTRRRLGHRMIRRRGTRFVDADQTGSDFTGTDAGRCGARGATVTDVTWHVDVPLPVDVPDPGADDVTSSARTGRS